MRGKNAWRVLNARGVGLISRKTVNFVATAVPFCIATAYRVGLNGMVVSEKKKIAVFNAMKKSREETREETEEKAG